MCSLAAALEAGWLLMKGRSEWRLFKERIIIHPTELCPEGRRWPTKVHAAAAREYFLSLEAAASLHSPLLAPHTYIILGTRLKRRGKKKVPEIKGEVVSRDTFSFLSVFKKRKFKRDMWTFLGYLDIIQKVEVHRVYRSMLQFLFYFYFSCMMYVFNDKIK